MTVTLADLVYSRLCSDAAVSGNLARYADGPAIFYQSAPSDKDSAWAAGSQYPRIDYMIDMQANPERQTSGVLSLNIWCDETTTPPEDIEPSVRGLLCDIFIQPSSPSPPYSLAWARSDGFETKSRVKPETLVNGVSMAFDIFAFPQQITIDPDPILSMDQWMKGIAPEAVVIGYDELAKFMSPTETQPAVYFRLIESRVYQETNAVVWFDATISGHVFAPTPEARLGWLRHIANSLAISGEVTMPDKSPMFIRDGRITAGADPLAIGQLRLSVRFGVLRRPQYAHPQDAPRFVRS